MSWFPTGTDNQGQATIAVGDNNMSSMLWQLLTVDEIIPGTAPGYNTCKIIYTYHPLGRKMVELPLEKAFSQKRKLTFSDPAIGPLGDELLRRFQKEWDSIGGLGANTIIYRIAVLSRIYGVGSLLVGTRGADPDSKLDYDTIHKQDLYFSMLDPLNTAGSLVLQQDPTAPDFLQPQQIWAAGKNLHPTRTCVLIHEQPIWIEWTDSAFGFNGRSVFQRSLYPLKSYLFSLVADNEIQRKLMLLIAKMKSPGSVVDKRTFSFFGLRRSKLKDSHTGNVLSIGIEEAIESLNLEHTDKAGTYARNNILRNIAASSGMPAILMLDERIADGFGEGKEDAKEISIYIDSLRKWLGGSIDYLQDIVMRRAWNPDWYAAIQSNYSEYQGIDYDAAFYKWKDAFTAEWPDLYQPSESEQMEAEAKKIMVALKTYESLSPSLDPSNQASMLEWVQDMLHETRLFSQSDLEFDPDTFVAHAEEQAEQQREQLETMKQSSGEAKAPSVRLDEVTDTSLGSDKSLPWHNVFPIKK